MAGDTITANKIKIVETNNSAFLVIVFFSVNCNFITNSNPCKCADFLLTFVEPFERELRKILLINDVVIVEVRR